MDRLFEDSTESPASTIEDQVQASSQDLTAQVLAHDMRIVQASMPLSVGFKVNTEGTQAGLIGQGIFGITLYPDNTWTWGVEAPTE